MSFVNISTISHSTTNAIAVATITLLISQTNKYRRAIPHSSKSLFHSALATCSIKPHLKIRKDTY
jgi:hypothetical protein